MRRKHIKITAFLLVVVLGLTAYKPAEKYFEISKNLDIFATLYREVNKYYVDDVSPSELMKTGIDAMLNTLDPYTNYIPEDRIEDYRTITTGEYGGIGAVIGRRNDKVMVLMPNKGYPADRAGLEIGDEIIAIDGIQITERHIDDISKLLKGQAGTNLSLKIKRYGKNAPFDVTLKRERIKLNNVPYHGMVSEDIGMIQLTDFTRNASKEVKSALVSLKDKGAKKIILDLRGNPGGLLSEAINISNVFLPKGHEIVSTKGKIKDWNRMHKALNPAVDTDIPIAVLINGSSASASEIVSGVIQDYDRGVLVGSRSFGKGLVQATRSLTYNSKLKVTVAKYYIPSGRCIQEIDYSKRDDEGAAEKIPDSLRVAFKTKNGRVVYDGGGVMPDVEVKLDNFAPITVSLISKGLIFDYATKYKHDHAEIDPALSFSLSDEEYKEFMAWLGDKDYDYQTKVENSLKKLISSAKDDKYYEDIKTQIYALKTKISHNKESDLIKFKDQIREELEKEIVSRYYFQVGQIEASFDDNKEIKTAIELLNDTEKYNEILKGE
ncbi:MAG: S41 family peptidase [Flammeovirgaceae bacterium]